MEVTEVTDLGSLFAIHEIIVRGPQGVVFRAIDKMTSEIVAIEMMLLIDDDRKQAAIRNAEILSQLDCLHLPKMLGIFQFDKILCIVHEYVEGVPISKIKEVFQFEEIHIATILWDVLKVLECVHIDNKIYGFLCQTNIVINEHFDVKLTNYGVTYAWQQALDDCVHTCKSDILNLGFTAFNLLTVKNDHVESTAQESANDFSTVLANTSEEFKDFLSKCVNNDPKLRSTAQDLLHHPFMDNAVDNIVLREAVENFQKLGNKDEVSSREMKWDEKITENVESLQLDTKKQKYSGTNSVQLNTENNGDISLKDLERVLTETVASRKVDSKPLERSFEIGKSYLGHYKKDSIVLDIPNTFSDSTHGFSKPNENRDHAVVVHDKMSLVISQLKNAFEAVNHTCPLMLSEQHQNEIIGSFENFSNQLRP